MSHGIYVSSNKLAVGPHSITMFQDFTTGKGNFITRAVPLQCYHLISVEICGASGKVSSAGVVIFLGMCLIASPWLYGHAATEPHVRSLSYSDFHGSGPALLVTLWWLFLQSCSDTATVLFCQQLTLMLLLQQYFLVLSGKHSCPVGSNVRLGHLLWKRTEILSLLVSGEPHLHSLAEVVPGQRPCGALWLLPLLKGHLAFCQPVPGMSEVGFCCNWGYNTGAWGQSG